MSQNNSSYSQPVTYRQQSTHRNPQYGAPAPMYAYTPMSQSYGNKPETNKIVSSVLTLVLVTVGFVLALLGVVLPFLTRARSISLIRANIGAGLSVILVALLLLIFIIIAVFSARRNVTVSRIFALLGGLGGIFLIVFTLANLFGPDARHIIDIGGSRGVGGALLVIGGIVAVLSAVLAMLASFSSSSPAHTSAGTPTTIPAGTPAVEPAQPAMSTQQVSQPF